MKIADIEYLNNIPLSRCVGRLIRMMRIQKGLTGSELAKQVHLSQQQISRYELGQTKFQLDILLRLFFALNMNEKEIESFFSFVTERMRKII